MFRTLIIVTTTTVSSSLAKGRSLPTEIRVIRSFLGDKGDKGAEGGRELLLS
ncbi:hypothetical protein [Scytonema millei]|uniref:Uncharacterized protein n=1 Tax=Scytonema millei VB511283 TaxID=1245923 RepID=A0A9X5I369_9CYAN|nr:hypothetical protein [Scytonema millei]NHC33209.1 hypothetical protein [Scytonema millei VB511283]